MYYILIFCCKVRRRLRSELPKAGITEGRAKPKSTPKTEKWKKVRSEQGVTSRARVKNLPWQLFIADGKGVARDIDDGLSIKLTHV